MFITIKLTSINNMSKNLIELNNKSIDAIYNKDNDEIKKTIEEGAEINFLDGYPP